MERGGLISKPEAFARILTALQPDVPLFSELTDKESAAIAISDTHAGTRFSSIWSPARNSW